MALVPVMKFGGLTLQGKSRFGPNEDRLLDECHRAQDLNEIYRTLAARRNMARAQRLREVARDFILPAWKQGIWPVVVVSAFDWATDKLEHLLACIDADPSPRESARLLMSGELRANSALAIALSAVGCPACSMTGREAGIITSASAVGARIEQVDTEYVQSLLSLRVIPVVAGFQGYYHDPQTGRDEVSILGRGGSNLTAVALADALDQPSCTMFSDVDGLYDKDPRRYDDARKVSEISGPDLLEWESFPQVIQREAVEYAVAKGVDIWLRSGFEPEAPGSRIICRRQS